MAPKASPTPRHYVLPLSVVGPVDLGRLFRELDALDESLAQLALRKKDGDVKMPKTSKLMDTMIEINKLNLLKPAERRELLVFLKHTREHAPALHISFGSDPSPAFIEKLMAWLRANIDPAVIITIGLQPNIGAGCLVRSTNKYYDFSLRDNFSKNRELLMSKLREVAPV